MASSSRQALSCADLLEKSQQIQDINKHNANEMAACVNSLLTERLSIIQSALKNVDETIAPTRKEIEDTLKMLDESMKRAENALAQDAAKFEKQIGLLRVSQSPPQETLAHAQGKNAPSPLQKTPQSTLKKANMHQKDQSRIAKNRRDRRTTRRVGKPKPKPVIESSSSEEEDDENDEDYVGNTL